MTIFEGQTLNFISTYKEPIVDEGVFVDMDDYGLSFLSSFMLTASNFESVSTTTHRDSFTSLSLPISRAYIRSVDDAIVDYTSVTELEVDEVR